MGIKILIIRGFSLALLFAISINISYAQEKKFTEDILNNPQKYGKKFERLFNLNELPIYDTIAHKDKVILKNSYAQYRIQNPEDWTAYRKNIVVTQIDVVYTKYPKNKEFWRTNYYSLLANRIKALFALDSTLNSADFEWNIKYQTNCNNEVETKKMFHGICIHYFKIDDFEKEESTVNKIPETKICEIPEYNLKVQNFIRSQGGIGDSLVYRTFDQHPEWKNALVVMDWTGSMYRYGAQAILWHSMNFKTSGIKNFVFFNDGDAKKDWEKEIGKTGGIYFAQARHMDRLIKTFYLVGKRGKGGDQEENDIEALLKGMNRFQDFDELVLIADNNSCMRDFRLLLNLGVKVNIIACGTKHGLNPQYVNLAYLTGGSIHSLKEEITHLASKIKDDDIELKSLTYELNKEKLFQIKDPPQRIRFSICDEYTTLQPLTIDPHLAFIEKHGGIKDSTVYIVLDRHPAWINTTIVMNWTTSMYTQSAQAVLWHKTHPSTSGINHFAFYNDGNKLPEKKKKLGKTGGVFFAKSNNLKTVYRRCDYVAKRGRKNYGNSTNTMEAILYSMQRYHKTDEFILIVNNESCVRDFALIEKLNIPVKVIISNVKNEINPQFINIAYKSGGSLHTLDDDYYNYVFKSVASSTKELNLNGVTYVLNSEGYFDFKDENLRKTKDCKVSVKISFWDRLGLF